ncbi:MAG: hypothetical protein WC246_01865 [Candidatus Paceibacterota bacterium]|jgi:hypothetical protein
MKETFATIKKYQHDIYFTAIGLVVSALMIVFFVHALSFVAQELARALESNAGAQSVVRFNLDGLRQLNVGAPAQSAPSSTPAR